MARRTSVSLPLTAGWSGSEKASISLSDRASHLPTRKEGIDSGFGHERISLSSVRTRPMKRTLADMMHPIGLAIMAVVYAVPIFGPFFI